MAVGYTPTNLTQDQENELLYQWIGKAISHWSFVENALVSLLARAISPVSNIYITQDDGTVHGAGTLYHEAQTAQAILSAVENFRSKLALVDAALQVLVAEFPMLLECWEKLNAKVRRASGHRNKLAHWNVIVFSTKRPGHRACLVPPGLFTGIQYEGPRYTYRDVMRFSEVFSRTSQQLSLFGTALSTTPAIHDKYARLISGQMATYDQRSPNDAARLRQILQGRP